MRRLAGAQDQIPISTSFGAGTRHSGQAQRKPATQSRSPRGAGFQPGLLSAGVTFFRWNDEDSYPCHSWQNGSSLLEPSMLHILLGHSRLFFLAARDIDQLLGA